MFVIAQPEPGSTLRLKVYMEQKHVDRAYGKLFQDLANRGDIPGFRKGKVPEWRIRRQFGEGVIDGAIYGEVLELALRGALTYGEINATQPADLDEDEEERVAKQSQPLIVEALLKVRPETRIPDYVGIELEAPDAEPTDEQLEDEIKGLQDAAAELSEVDRKEVQAGDLVEIDLRTKVEGEEDDAPARPESLIVGEGRYDPALDEPLLGQTVGETVDFDVTYPDSESMGELAGKNVSMSADIKDLRERKIPELDDDFAANAVEGATTVDELREELTKRVRDRNQDLANTVMRANAAKWLRENVTIDMPAEFMETPADLGDDAPADDARDLIKLSLACEALLEQEGVEITEDELRAEYMMLGASRGLDAAMLAGDDMGGEVQGLLRDRIVRQKATDLIAQAATPKVIPMSELMGDDDDESDAAEGSDEATEE